MKITLLIVLGVSLVAGQVGHAQKKLTRTPTGPTNSPPVISKFESSSAVVGTCGQRMFCSPKERRTVSLTVTASDPNNHDLSYEYLATGGELLGSGAAISWKLGDQQPGQYSVTVKVSDSKGASATSTTKVRVINCLSCWFPDPLCPLVSISASSQFTNPDETYRGEVLEFHAKVVSDASLLTRPDFVWTVANGKILKGQHTTRIQVETTGVPGTRVSVTVDVEGYDLSCSKRVEHSVPIKP